ncbi:MAG: protein-glutamate O-methyltransferase [Nitrospinae bacterium]|nr:protein-glutamate O-methyltransferase [Nitrospinota bacterium]
MSKKETLDQETRNARSSGGSGIELSAREFEMFRSYIYEKSGINLHDGKRELVRTRLGSRLRALDLATYRDYFEYVRDDRSEQELVNMLDAISTNLTSFFREINHFTFLEQKVIPELLRRREKGEREIRAWSAGCSSGEEPYSIAFLLATRMPDGAANDIKILATDLSTRALGKAAKGVYSEEQVKTVPPDMRKQWLTTVVDEYGDKRSQVAPAIRKIVKFNRFNLMTPRFPFRRTFSFIFCRNVMIYFDKPTQETLVNKYYDVLAKGGYLFIGHSESLTGVKHGFRYVQPTIYQKPA